MSLFKHLSHVSYPVMDWQQAKKFYSETLGLRVAAFISDETGWMEFGNEDETVRLAIALWQDSTPPPRRGAIAIFEVDDAYKTIEELRKRGVRCKDVEGIPGMTTWASFYDPEGNELQVAGPPPNS